MKKLNYYLKFLIILKLTCLSFCSHAQSNDSWSVYLVKKNYNHLEKTDKVEFAPSGFYLARNCYYDLKLLGDQYFSGRLASVKPDTLFFTNAFNQAHADARGVAFDTISFHFRQIQKLRLLSDRSLGLYQQHDLSRYLFHFIQDNDQAVELKSIWEAIYQNDTAKYEVVPHLTAQGITYLFEENGITYFFFGSGMIKADKSKIDTTFKSISGAWLTPCKVEKINGLAFGLKAINWKNMTPNIKDSLEVNGLNIEVDPFSVLLYLANVKLTGPHPDSIDFYEKHLEKVISTTINGINISAGHNIQERKIKGINITGILMVIDEMYGLSVSGISSFAYKQKGLSIAAISNRATSMRGVQIGLFNRSKKLRGFQFGLWNKNGKRSLPLINWQFKD